MVVVTCPTSSMSCSCGLPPSPSPAVLASLDPSNPLEQFAPSVDRAVFLTLQGSNGIKLSWAMDCTEALLRTWWHQEGTLKMKPPVSEFPQPASTARHEERFPCPFLRGPGASQLWAGLKRGDPASTQLRVFLSSVLSVGLRP